MFGYGETSTGTTEIFRHTQSVITKINILFRYEMLVIFRNFMFHFAHTQTVTSPFAFTKLLPKSCLITACGEPS